MAEFDILQAVGAVGFPIVAFLLVYIKSDETIKNNTQAINNNNVILARICEKLNLSNLKEG